MNKNNKGMVNVSISTLSIVGVLVVTASVWAGFEIGQKIKKIRP